MMPCPTLTSWERISQESDIDILSGAKTHNATGPDQALARLLKEAADQFAPIF